MQEYGLISSASGLDNIGLKVAEAHWNLSPAQLVEEALANKEGQLASSGAFTCDTGKFTGRSPKDRFVVRDAKTEDSVWWGDINIPISTENYQKIKAEMIDFLANKKVYVRDAFAGVDEKYRLKLRVINTLAWHNNFCYNMFLRPTAEELESFVPNFTIICAPEFEVDPATHGTRQKNFAIVNFTERTILIGGTAYAGEMKKGIFSVMNFLLPHDFNVLSMHCSANESDDGDVSIFFGLSGTGKTTLSADPHRHLIGDDEHGWTDNGVFNFEGGCYAKVINLSRETEPDIYDAIKFGSIVENTRFVEGTRDVDYENDTVTENTRASYPIHHINNAKEPSAGGIPKHIFFLTCDADGVLPPIAKLSKGQAMYHFISGYTAKVAGTEAGVKDPTPVFSACFGSPFLPLHPTRYAELLGKKMDEHNVSIWLVNTGWSGGPFGVGKRMKLRYTRAMITAAMEGNLDKVEYANDPTFGISVPQSCPDVPNEVLNPRDTWEDKGAYDAKAQKLAGLFVQNFDKFKEFANDEIMAGAPKTGVNA